MPNFLIIGANKAGTTAIHSYLKQHPQVYMSPVKEPMFFTLEGKKLDRTRPGHQITLKNGVNNIDDYQALFQGVSNEKAIGEASTAYLHRPWSADRIMRYIPNVKLIAILRDPVERAYSNYLMYVRWGLETLNFPQAVREEEIRISNNYPQGWHYVKLGFYYQPLMHFSGQFHQSQIKVYLYEDFVNSPVRFFQDLFRFLDVDESFVPDMSIKHNVSPFPRNKALHSFIMTQNSFKTMLKPFIPSRLRRHLTNDLKKRNLVKPKLPQKVRKQLVEVYREDILRLQNLIERDLSKWLD